MDEIFKMLNPDNTVTINRPLAHALGTNEAIIYAALIAKQAYYVQREMLDNGGYFYSTITDLEESTTLSKRQQSAAIKTLVEVGLIDCQKRGMPARRCFRVNDDAELLNSFIERGKSVGTKCNNKSAQNVPTSERENTPLVGAKCNDKSEQNVTYTYNLKEKSKVNNPNQSIYPDGIDRIDSSDNVNSLDNRERYREAIHANIEYEFLSEKEKVEVDELVEIMLDVICSANKTVRVNGEDMPDEVVKSRFLKLDSSHIDYVLTSLKKNTTEVRNIRAYLITALYNAPATLDSYYTARVNHDLYGSA